MSASAPVTGSDTHTMATALGAACERIAPVWPLDRWIAVNPWWGLRQQTMAQASQLLQRQGSAGLLMEPGFFRDAWESGRIETADLEAAAREAGVSVASGGVEQQAMAWLDRPRTTEASIMSAVATVTVSGGDSLEQRLREQLGAICAQFFDQRQARWRKGSSGETLFAYWHRSGLPALVGMLPGNLRKMAKAIPDQWPEAAEQMAAALNLSESQATHLSHHLLLKLLGWASWCRGEDWRAGLTGAPTEHTQSLAGIWLISEWLALQALPERDQNRIRESWQPLPTVALNDEPHGLWVWQRAYEHAWQRRFFADLSAGQSAQPDTEVRPEVQAAFCIDVRSEVFRRHFEAAYPEARTSGVAGFFGMPVAHCSHGPSDDEHRLPGLLAPGYRYIDTTGDAERDRTLNLELDRKEQLRESVRRAKYSSLSTFTLVETTGLAWVSKLIKDSLHKRKQPATGGVKEGRLHHLLGGDPVADPERVRLAEGLLRTLSLTGNFPSVLLMVGHGSQTDNNPNEAGLACGACGGKNGGINARVSAELLNDRLVRAGLAERGIVLPESTLVLAAEHNTVTDTVMLLDTGVIPQSHKAVVDRLKGRLLDAGVACRRERATALKLNGLNDDELKEAMALRTRNWAEVRPEWGLANNAALIIAPRDRTREVNLAGRCFLHDYDPALDEAGQVLHGLMNAPMVVANWINLQYYASVVQPQVYGAGNKLLHSVVGGNLGVIEGNGIDLRIGLPVQSVHDGERWRHEPQRLTVIIDAPAERIETVLANSPDVRALVDNQWLYLCRFTEQGIARYDQGEWCPAIST
ncbi:MAG: DUF2309 domain-containing protein [Pseudomonadota bacterium]|nr:DUF2309 domain-containing protein [Pseudomonadota bacterium]